MRKKYTALSLSLLLILLLVTLPAYAASLKKTQEIRGIDSGCGGPGSTVPDQGSISSLEDLVQWHSALSGWYEWPVLEEDIIINRSVTLSDTSKQKELGAVEHIIRVTAGGRLTINNPKLIIQGPKAVIIVEPGGQLLLQSGAIYTAPDSYAVVVEKGGKAVKSSAFLMDGGGILDKNQSNELPVDPNPAPDPEPQPPVHTVRPITNIVGFDFSLNCSTGERPVPSDYPATVPVAYLATETHYGQIELPVRWILDSVNFYAAGTYKVKGIFSEEVLTAHHLSNPDGISASLTLSVQDMGAIKSMKGNILSISTSGRCLIRLTFPLLPSDATALYIYRSADGQHWQKCVGQDGLTAYDDFLPYIQTVSPNTYVNYRYQTDYHPIWLRLEVVGSSAAGISNEIKLEMTTATKPGEGSDDGSSGGNRGGGGQSESGRDLPVLKQTDQAGSPPISPGIPPGDTALSTVPTSGGAPQDKAQNSDTAMSPGAPDDNSASIPAISTASNAGHMEQGELAVSSPMPVQNQDAGPAAEELAADQGQNNPPLPKSQGVLLTFGTTILAASGFILHRKLYQKKKRKP